MSEAGLRPWAGRHLHFTGIGGCGMSGLALVAAARGATVTGSDLSEGPYLERLREAGCEVRIGHDPAYVAGATELVYSSAIPASNTERRAALSAGIAQLARGDLLAELVAERRSIAIAGTHGKTTTAGMVAHLLRAVGESVDYVIGGDLLSTGRNAHWSESSWLVVEADESDRSLLALRPGVGVLTNVEHEHVEIYPSYAEVAEVFRAFLAHCHMTVGADLVSPLSPPAVLHPVASDITTGVDGCSFSWRGHRVALRVLGAHNVANAVSALETCVAIGVEPAAAVAAIADFPGIARRVQPLGLVGDGALLIDDYAHHPTQVSAAIATVRAIAATRVVVAFRPWGLERTRAMADGYAAALTDADVLVVVDAQAGYGQPGGAALVVSAVRRACPDREVRLFVDPRAVALGLAAHLGAGAVCLTIGCADVAAALIPLVPTGTRAAVRTP